MEKKIESNENNVNKLISLMFFISIFIYIGSELNNIIPYIIIVFLIFAYIYRITFINKKNVYKIILFIIIYALIFIINYAYFPETRFRYESETQRLFLNALIFVPIGVLLSTFGTNDKTLKSLYSTAVIGSTILMILQLILKESQSYQSFGIHLSLFYGIMLANLLKYKKYSSLIFIIPILYFILYSGRQNLVSLLVLTFVLVLYNLKSNTKIYLIFIIPIITLIIFLSLDQLTISFLKFANTLNIDTRTVESILNNSLFDTSNRKHIYDYSIEIISRSPFEIRGIFGDSAALRYRITNITYAHNILLELVLDFGLFLGLLLFVIFVFKTISFIMKNKTKDKNFFIILLTLLFIRFLVSDSIFINSFFIVLLGLLFTKDRKEGGRHL